MALIAKQAYYLTEGWKMIKKEKEKTEAEKQFHRTIKKIDKDILKRIKEGQDSYLVNIDNQYLRALVMQYYQDLGYCVSDDFTFFGDEVSIFWSKELIK